MWMEHLEVTLAKQGGGILRNYRDHILFAFSHFYDIQTNTIVEAMAIRDSLLLCEAHNLQDIVLELNSRLLVDMLCSVHCSH